MQIKTISVTNPKNVLVQIPGCVVAKWCLNTGSKIEVNYDDIKGCLELRPTIQRRVRITPEIKRLVRNAAGYKSAANF